METINEDILNCIRKIIINTFQYPKMWNDIELQTSIVWNIGINSIDFMRLISILEEEYDVILSLEELEIDIRVGDIVEMFMKCLKSKYSDGIIQHQI